MYLKSFSEALKGNQHKLDKNKNGKIDAHDFKLLQKEEDEDESQTVDRVARADYKIGPSGRKTHKQIVFKEQSAPFDGGTAPKPAKKNSDGTTQNPMSRARELAKQAMKKKMKEEFDIDMSEEQVDSILECMDEEVELDEATDKVTQRRILAQKQKLARASTAKEAEQYRALKHKQKLAQAKRMSEEVELEESTSQEYAAKAKEAHAKYLHHEDQVDKELRKVGERMPNSWDAARFNTKLSSHPKYAQALKHYNHSEKFASQSIRYKNLAKKKSGVKEEVVAEGKYNPAKDTFNPETHTAVTRGGVDKVISKTQLDKHKETGWKQRHSLSAFHKNREKQGMKEEVELDESHFKLGDKVKCKSSGMVGKVVKLDEPDGPDDKEYYTVKHENGKTMKHAPNDLTMVKEEADLGHNESVNESSDVESIRDRIESLRKDLKAVRGSYPGDDRNRSLIRSEIFRAKEQLKAASSKKRVVKEEAEQIDELSKKTLGSYVKKAASSLDSTAYSAGRRGEDEDYIKSMKRRTGIEKAADRLAKEEFEIEEQAPVAPTLDRKYIKGTPEHKAYKATKKPITGHPTNVKEQFNSEGTDMAEKITFGDFIAKMNEQLLEYESDESGIYRHTKKATYGTSYQGDDDEDEKKPKQPAEKRGRGRPAGAKSGARKITGTSKLYK